MKQKVVARNYSVVSAAYQPPVSVKRMVLSPEDSIAMKRRRVPTAMFARGGILLIHLGL